jgi:hypothetical protein
MPHTCGGLDIIVKLRPFSFALAVLGSFHVGLLVFRVAHVSI